MTSSPPAQASSRARQRAMSTLKRTHRERPQGPRMSKNHADEREHFRRPSGARTGRKLTDYAANVAGPRPEPARIMASSAAHWQSSSRSCSREPRETARKSMHCKTAKRTERRRLVSIIGLVGLLALAGWRWPALVGAGAPPRITIQPNDLVAIEGESAELNCDAEGQPEPTIEWFHDGQPIRSSTNSRTTMGGSIQFLDIRPNTTAPASASAATAASEAAAATASSSPSPAQRQPQPQPQPQQQQQSDAGVYHCVARNQLGEARSRNATLQVAYIREQFKAAPRDKLAAVGDTVTFHCLPQAWPEPAIQWRRNGRLLELASQARYSVQRIARTELQLASETLAGELVDVFGSRLVIKQVEKADEGRFSCLVETRGSHRLIERESPAGQLTAAVKPYFIEPPEHRSGQAGDRLAMRCRMAGDPEPVISWRRQNGQPLSEKTTIEPSDKTLIIEALKPSDQGVYICEGENSIGSARALAQVQVTSRPKFNVQPSDQTAELGSRVQLKCAGEASPPPMMFWYKEGHRQLMFPPAQQAAAAAGSGFGTASNWPNAAPRSPPAGWPQAAALTNSDTSPATNRLFSMPMEHLAASAAASAASQITDYFGNRIYVDSQGTLNIINVTASDNGYYACALISSVGSVMAKAKVTVKQSVQQPANASPSTSDFYSDPLQQARLGLGGGGGVKYDLLPPPVIKMGSANQTLPTNTSATLLCDVVSQVAYKIQWFFDSQPLQEEPPRITVLDNGNLGIQNLKTSDSGLYTCVVTAANDQTMPISSPFEPLEASMLTSAPPVQQSTAHSSMLKVANPINPNIQFYRMDLYAYPSPPGPPYMVSTNGDDAITIAWAAPADSGALPIKQYVVEHYDTSQEHLGWRIIHRPNGKESLLIDGLSPDGSHFFVVRATNSHGTGPSSAIAGPFRTVSGDHRYQFEQQRRRNPTGLDFADTRADTSQARDRLMTVTTNLVGLTPINSNSIRLQWTTQGSGNSSFAPLNSLAIGDFLEGYSIRYRAVGVGESLLGRDPFLSLALNQYDARSPASLPLVTSYIDEQELFLTSSSSSSSPSSSSRLKRDFTQYYDYSQEFNEVRITDHNVEHYTINGLKPFTAYQFFVVPYYKDIDGIPSNILTAQTNEDRPSVAPPVPTIRPINSTAIKLLWPHIPSSYANGIIRGYIIRINNSDILNGPATTTNLQIISATPKILTLPLSSLAVAPLATQPSAEPRGALISGSGSSSSGPPQQYVVIYDITNLTFKSFYSIQVAGSTSVGHGPWSESRNFVMDPKKIAEQLRSSSSELDDLMSQSFLAAAPNLLDDPGRSRDMSSFYIVLPLILLIACVLFLVGLVLYRRNNHQVTTWKKTISEHFNNKFYMPSAADHHRHHGAPGSIQQNIYDHQHHLIYSAGSTHMPPAQQQTAATSQTMWAAAGINNGTAACMTSSGTGSLSSHGGLLPISNDPNSTRARNNNDQILLMNNHNKDAPRFIRGTPVNGNNQLFCQANPNADSTRTINPIGQQQQQIIHHGGDYYSVINNVAEYEELDQQQRNHNMRQMAVSNPLERHQTGSSNSDTSCPSSVTRLLPNQNYNRDLLTRNQLEQQQQQHRHEMILQQQIGCNGDAKQPFITMINGNDTSKYLTQKAPLSPYATTNLMSQMAGNQHPQPVHHMFANTNQMGMSREQQQNFMMHNGGGGSTMDDSSKILMAQQMNGNGAAVNSFRTLQRNHHNNLQPSIVHSQPTHVQQIFMQQNHDHGPYHQGGGVGHGNYGIMQINSNHVQGNLMSSSGGLLADEKPNLYEHIDYNGGTSSHQQQQQKQVCNVMQMDNIHRQQQQGDLISSSTSSGSVRSPPELSQARYRRGPQSTSGESEAHDLRVFSTAHGSRPSDVSERQRLTDGADGVGAPQGAQSGDVGGGANGEEPDEDASQVDETTAFRRQSAASSDEQRTRQLSKRKRKQQRNRLLNNNQKVID